MQTKHAVFATVKVGRSKVTETSLTFRLGRETDWNTAVARWDRLDRQRMSAKGLRVKHDGRTFPVAFLEVRAVDNVGRGLGSERHASAMPKPLRRDRRSTTLVR